jgi:NTE family protein
LPKTVHLFALVLLFISSPLVTAQQTTGRPRVGIALSGGGALGLAHVGVLKYFEDHHIPVDAVAGTSMGGLVGGFYATGLNSRQLEAVVHEANFDALLRPGPNYEERPIAEKQDWNHSDAGFTMRFKHNLSLPTGLNPGGRLALLLSRYTAAYAGIRNFDDLPTRFRCVATDLTSAGAFTLDSGSLPLALRATMAIPGIFTPVKWGDHVLVDGGAVDNIPVDVARQMETDRVIAVSLETAPASKQSLSSLTGVLRQVVSVVVLENERRSLKQADLVIAVPLQKYTSDQYSHANEIIAAGYEAAAAMEDKLKPFEVSEAEWQQHEQLRQSRTKTVPGRGAVVAVSSPQKDIERDASHELKRKLPGEVDGKKLENTLTGIVAAASLPSAYYGWGEANGQSGYKVDLEERAEGGEVLIRPSLAMQASGGEPTRTSLNLSFARSFGEAYKSRLLSQATIGYDPGIRAEYYKPFDGEPYFVAPGLLFQRTHEDSYAGPKLNQFLRDRVAGTFYAGVGTWRFVQWRVGSTAGYDHYSRTVTEDGITASSTGFANVETKLLIDSQDSGVLPSTGTRLSASLGYSFRDHSYPYVDGQFSRFLPVRKGVGLFALGRGASSFGRNLSYYDRFTAGGLADLSAFRLQEFHANTLATGGGGGYFAIPKWGTSSVTPVVAAWHEVGRFDLGSRGWETHQSGSIGVFLKTPLGPTGLILSVNEDRKARARFVFGRF